MKEMRKKNSSLMYCIHVHVTIHTRACITYIYMCVGIKVHVHIYMKIQKSLSS